jgi:hypothetical protein
MAKQLRQVVTQDDQSGMLGPIPKRIIVQWVDSESGDNNQEIVEYDNMTTEAKAIYDTFVQMCEVYMNQ